MRNIDINGEKIVAATQLRAVSRIENYGNVGLFDLLANFRISFLMLSSITDLHFHDLRGTAVTRLAEAECTNAEIASITGHAMRDVARILDRYLARTDKIALAAIAKLERGKA